MVVPCKELGMVVYVIVMVLTHQDLFSVQAPNSTFRTLEDCEVAKKTFLEILEISKPHRDAYAIGQCVSVSLGANT
jgi:hypothetical protein